MVTVAGLCIDRRVEQRERRFLACCHRCRPFLFLFHGVFFSMLSVPDGRNHEFKKFKSKYSLLVLNFTDGGDYWMDGIVAVCVCVWT